MQFPEPQAARVSSQAVVVRFATRVYCYRLEAERAREGEVESGWIGRGPSIGAGWESRLGLE